MNHKPRYLQAEQGSKERWLISYTDFVTILMILFVAIAAQGYRGGLGLASAHTVKPPEAAPKPAPPKPQPEPRQILKDADQKLRRQGLDSRLEKRGLVITLPQAILFPSGEDHIVPSALPVLSEIA